LAAKQENTSLRERRNIERMVFDSHLVHYILIDGRKEAFDATGHYPILAGAGSTGKERYVAFHVVLYKSTYVSSVSDGDRKITFVDNKGIMVDTHDFFIPVLRYNPSDLINFEQTPEDAIDRTGPLYWRREDILDGPSTIDRLHEEQLNGSNLLQVARDPAYQTQSPALVGGSGGKTLPSIEG